jgi:hypothetical protein
MTTILEDISEIRDVDSGIKARVEDGLKRRIELMEGGAMTLKCTQVSTTMKQEWLGCLTSLATCQKLV